MQRRILLIDGTGLIFRAYYSIRSEMTTPDGVPVNAVYGLVRMVMKAFRDVRSTAGAVAFDAGKRTFRNEMFPEYKAQRESPPEELCRQFELSQDTVRAMEVPVYCEEGYEADDIIATLARQARAVGHAVTILTSDRDILQLVGEDCELLMPMGGGVFKTMDLPAFDEKYGFPVERFVDFKAIMGDPSDNIPGIKGIGEKGAAKLVATYGRLEQIYANLDMVRPDGVRRKLQGAKDEVFLYRDLVTLKDDVPVEYDFAGRTLPNFAGEEFQQRLADYGFGGIRRDAEAAGDLMVDTL